MEIKNWCDDTSYEYLLNEKNRHIWTWEFLRRNLLYQNDWIDFSKLKDEYKAQYGEEWFKKEKTKKFQPPKLEGESASDWLNRILSTTICEPFEITLEQHYCDKWHMFGGIEPLIQTLLI